MIQELPALYGVRSALVHGDHLEKRVSELLKVVARHQEVVRTDFGVVALIARHYVLRALCRITRSPTLLDDLDEILLSAGVEEVLWMRKARSALGLDSPNQPSSSAPPSALASGY